MQLNWLLLTLSLVLFVPARLQAEHRALLPTPQHVDYGDEFIPLRNVVIRFVHPPTDADRFAAQQLEAGLAAAAHLQAPLTKSARTGHQIRLNRTGNGPDVPVDNDVAGPPSRESYEIVVNKNGAEIRAKSSAGLYYGVQTLLQMVEETNGEAVLPAARVQDWPALAYRGFMMDFSEGQLLRVEEVKRQLDLLARFKANQYYFYSEMSIAWAGYEMVNPEGRYTQEQVREVIAYARQRHIDVVPCVELYGHMHELFRTEKFAELGLPRYGAEFDPRNPRSLEIIDDLFDQTIRLFPSPWCHVGFDEPWSLGKIGMTPGKDPFQQFIGVLQHLADRARLHGKRLMYWADIGNGASTLSNHPELLRELPAGAIAGPWSYDAESNYTQYIEPLASNGVATMVTPAVWNWNELFPDYHRSFVDINGMVAAGKRLKTLGVLNTGWTDCAQTLYRQSWAGLAFGAAAGWQDQPVNTNSFFHDYCAIVYPAKIADEVSLTLEELSRVESTFESALGDNTQHLFWKDPLQPSLLARIEQHREECHTARVLAEEAQEHLAHAMQLAPNDPTLPSLMMAARLFDYLGMKSLYAAEWDGYFKELHAKPDKQLITLYLGIQMNQQGNGMLADLLDAVTDLREQYRTAWLAESKPHRLGAALARWDAESAFWLSTWARVNHLLQTHKNGEPFPGLDAIRTRAPQP
jgi:hypothetical protein